MFVSDTFLPSTVRLPSADTVIVMSGAFSYPFGTDVSESVYVLPKASFTSWGLLSVCQESATLPVDVSVKKNSPLPSP